jgi:hypothetical protein
VKTIHSRPDRTARSKSSLALLLAEHRGRRTGAALPALTVAQILAWADAHHERTGSWPTHRSGPIAGAPGETWRAANDAVLLGVRGLPGGRSLASLLAERRGTPPRARNPWTAEQDELLRSLTPEGAASRTGRPRAAVYRRRHRLRVPDARKKYRGTAAAPYSPGMH